MSKEFRAELLKLMPGYDWTIHKPRAPEVCIDATGAQSKGFSRLSTLHVERRNRDGVITYTVKSAGYGLRAKWLHECSDGTLARALRKLQTHYERTAQEYQIHAADLALGRKQKEAS